MSSLKVNTLYSSKNHFIFKFKFSTNHQNTFLKLNLKNFKFSDTINTSISRLYGLLCDAPIKCGPKRLPCHPVLSLNQANVLKETQNALVVIGHGCIFGWVDLSWILSLVNNFVSERCRNEVPVKEVSDSRFRLRRCLPQSQGSRVASREMF